MMEVAVLIPCYNEELTVEKVVRDFKKNYRMLKSMFTIITVQIVPQNLH